MSVEVDTKNAFWYLGSGCSFLSGVKSAGGAVLERLLCFVDIFTRMESILMVEEIFIPIITIKVCECVEIDFAQICSIWIFPGLRRGFLAPLKGILYPKLTAKADSKADIRIPTTLT